MTLRFVSFAAVALLLGAAGGTSAQDATFPARTVVLVTPYPPGGTSDTIPRAVAPLMSQSLGVPVIVENRAGANGSIGAAYVAKAKPDGHTLLMAPTGVLAINQWLYSELPYNPEKDFAPVTNAASTPNMLVAHPSVQARNLRDLVALAKAKPKSLSFASAGNGSTSHLCGELLKTLAGIEVIHVPYKGVGPAQQDLLGGQVSMMCDNFSNVVQHVRSGRLHGLALAASSRHPEAQDVPTAAEAGLPGLDAGVWYSFVAPAGTPPAVIARLNQEFAKALHNPNVSRRLHLLGLTIVADSPEQFGKFIQAESLKWQRVVKASGAKVD